MRPRLALACALFTLLIAGPTSAQNREVKPYFLFVVDTSGSMAGANSAPANSCGFTGGNSATGGTPTRLDAVKCALGKIINAAGDVDFGLMQFADDGKNCGGPMNCGPFDTAAWLRVPIQTNSWKLVLPLLDKAGSSNTSPTDELCGGGYTPLGGVLIGAREYFEGTLPNPAGGTYPAPTVTDAALRARMNASGKELCRPLSVILLTDGAECCNNCMTAWSDGCPKTIAANPAAGVTCDTGCVTPVGDPSCTNSSSENAPDRAYEMLAQTMVPSAEGMVFAGIKTYAIGFGGAVTPPNARIEHIAIGGGTDNPDPNLRGFYASNEAQLSTALSQIIADAQPPAEICNNLDDDCDMLVDEGIPKYCDIPNGITDKTLCDPPAETLCDGIDDNCNGLIDEGLLNACGTCGAVPPEVCDGMDNDCDGRVDEEIGGAACGTNVGICMPGMLQCISGMSQCTGEVGPQPESCNCKDDDCDGFVNEDTANNLCPDGKCVGCECIPRCAAGAEFMAECDHGLRPDIQPSGECLCVTDDCDAKSCSASTLMRDDEVSCAPNDPKVAACLCLAGMCIARCDGVSCASDQICNKRNGRCVENNCLGLGCQTGELCDPVSGTCSKDACADANCKPTEVCRDGMCEPSCATVACNDGERCQAGRCVTDMCASARCAQGEACEPASGKCVADTCSAKTCGEGLACALASGECERDPCFGVHCPDQQDCAAGECQAKAGGTPPVKHKGSNPNARVLATGGGGCSCRVASTGRTGGAPSAVALALGLCLLWRRRRARVSRWLVPGLLPLLSLPLSGCTVDPFCIDCADAGHNTTTKDSGGPGTADGSARDGSSADAGGDAGMDGAVTPPPPTCKDPKPETCNGKDDDCDFKVDEDTVADVNNCEQHGVCAGTSPICLNGMFTCRYPDERETEETHCDGKDNDCDGRVDETFTQLNDACGVGVGACKVTGKQVCNPAGDGVTCVATSTIAPADEICDGIDNDCDGLVDEPRSNAGSSASFVVDDVVQAGASLWVYKYEASHPDAASDSQGIIGTRSCSRAGVLPWTNLTYSEALAACQAADMDLCQSCAVGDDTSGDGDHCPGNDWRTICEGSSACAWSYTPSGGCPTGSSASYPTTGSLCNGHNQAAQPNTPDNDALAVTGSLASCFTAVQGGNVFDLTGNAKEWTKGPHSPDTNPLRGGSYNNLPGGMRCDFNFNAAADNVRLPNVGFRCCSATDPTKP